MYAQPREAWPPQLAALWDRYVHASTVRFDAISPLQPSSPAGTAVVAAVRAVDPGDGLTAMIGGMAATGYDFLVSQTERIPYAVGVVLIAMFLVLFLLFGSVVLPIKAISMTLLSISASFGAMVWIFQEGNLSGPLGFTAPGFTIAGNPIIMFSVLFGLSMDYEVLLLSRVQEAYRRSGDNRAAVAEGLSKTAGVITGAAAIMVTVFAAFALADTITIKSIGVGMAIAVFVDATIVRILLVPATMRLLGKWNWWAPGPLARFADRLGLQPRRGRGDGAHRRRDPGDRRCRRPACRRTGLIRAPRTASRRRPRRRRPFPTCSRRACDSCSWASTRGGSRRPPPRHFANPRNDFWRLLEASGLTPVLLGPDRQREVLGSASGSPTPRCARRPGPATCEPPTSPAAPSVSSGSRPSWRRAVMAFVGKEAYRGAFGERPDLGLQPRSLASTRLFVLPSTSPANAAVPWAERLRWFRELAALVDRLAPRPAPGDRATLPSRGTEVP